jgi:small subunit ribosomal protein S15
MATAKKTASKAPAKKTAAKKTSKKTPKKSTTKKSTHKTPDKSTNVKLEKRVVIKKHQVHAKDTGSPKVQVAILTERISQLTDHLNQHPGDNHSRRGLLMMVGKRRKILRYMETKDKDVYGKFIKKMGIRK